MTAGSISKIIVVALVAALFSGCVGAVIVGAFGWPFSLSLVFAGAGAGAAAMRAAQRMKQRRARSAEDDASAA